MAIPKNRRDPKISISFSHSRAVGQNGPAPKTDPTNNTTTNMQQTQHAHGDRR